MTLVKTRKEFYLQQIENKKNNIVNGIPWHHYFPKLGSIIPSIPKGYQILWTASSGIGKTQSWMGIFILSKYRLKKEHPEIKLRLMVALLEDTKEMFVDRLYAMLFYEIYKIRIDVFTLHSLRDNVMDKEMLKKLDFIEKEVEFIMEDIEIVDSIYNPTGLYKWARAISYKYGKHHNKTMKFAHDDGTTKDQEVYSHYEQKDDNEQFLFIVDNLNNLAQEMDNGKYLSQLETINKWSRTYCRLQITKHWKWTVINIIQQASDSEKQQFDFKGNSIIEKIKPSLDGLGNSKECQRDHYLVMGLFAPARYGIKTYPQNGGYDIGRLGDAFRSLIILKSNLSASNIEIPLYFDGACSRVSEMPDIKDMDDKKYELIEKLRK